MQRGFNVAVTRGPAFTSGGGTSHQRHWIAIGRTRSYHAKARGLKPRGLTVALISIWRRCFIAIAAWSGDRDRSFTWASSDGADVSWKNSAIAARSNRDRGAIEPRSWSIWRGIILTGLENGRSSSRIMIVARSWPDRGPIVASFYEAKSTQQTSNSGATTPPSETAPLTLQIRVHDPLHHPRFRA